MSENFGEKCLVTIPVMHGGLAEATEMFRKEMLRATLKRTHGNRTTAARFLKVHRNTVNRLVLEYGLPTKRREWK